MLNTIFLVLGLILSTSGVILIYDARSITKKMFGFGDQNEATAGLNIVDIIFLQPFKNPHLPMPGI